LMMPQFSISFGLPEIVQKNQSILPGIGGFRGRVKLT
jgi:hypothetical protein